MRYLLMYWDDDAEVRPVDLLPWEPGAQ